MMHTTRHWIHENGRQNICVRLQKDIRNSFNEILPHEFLKDAQQYAPASARFAICYYGNSINIIYHGCVAKCNREQQGCPSWDPFSALSDSEWLKKPVAATPDPQLEFELAFADNTFSEGYFDNVYKIFLKNFNFSSNMVCIWDLASICWGDISRFKALGIKIVAGTDIMILKVPFGDIQPFLQDFYHQKFSEFNFLCSSLEAMSHQHVADYLFRNGGPFSNCSAGSAPPHAHILFHYFKNFITNKNNFSKGFWGAP